MKKIHCTNCNIEFEKSYFDKRVKNYFCSLKCKHEFHSKYMRGVGNSNYKNARILVKCVFCNKEYYQYKNYLKEKHYCSNECRISAVRKPKKIKAPRVKKIKPPKVLKYAPRQPNVLFTCPICNKTVSVKASSMKKRKVCSKACTKFWFSIKFKGEGNPFYNKKHSEESLKKISLAGGGTGVPYENFKYGEDFDDNLKEQIRFREGYKCKICGCSQLENGRLLSIHHIDYDKKHNEPSNFVALCDICHCKTNYNREYWLEFFKKLMKTESLSSVEDTWA